MVENPMFSFLHFNGSMAAVGNKLWLCVWGEVHSMSFYKKRIISCNHNQTLTYKMRFALNSRCPNAMVGLNLALGYVVFRETSKSLELNSQFFFAARKVH